VLDWLVLDTHGVVDWRLEHTSSLIVAAVLVFIAFLYALGEDVLLLVPVFRLKFLLLLQTSH
jgi:hypothetical protein